jgi:hypothetical protein
LKKSDIEKRAYKRIPVHLEGEFTSNDTNHTAYIRNVSEYGANAIFTSMKSAKNYITKTKHKLKIQLPSGETINLSCRGQWSTSISLQGFTKEIGLEIIDPPIQYKEFLSTL